jgi:hypothetical protein
MSLLVFVFLVLQQAITPGNLCLKFVFVESCNVQGGLPLDESHAAPVTQSPAALHKTLAQLGNAPNQELQWLQGIGNCSQLQCCWLEEHLWQTSGHFAEHLRRRPSAMFGKDNYCQVAKVFRFSGANVRSLAHIDS